MSIRAFLGLLALAAAIVGTVLYNLPDPVEQVNDIRATTEYHIELARRAAL